MPMTRNNKTNNGVRKLSGLELDVMLVIWEMGSATAREIKEALNASRPLAQTTILTVISRLRKKGYVREIPSLGRSLVFEALIPKDVIVDDEVKQIVNCFFKGSVMNLMVHVLQSENLDENQATDLRGIINQHVRVNDLGKAG
jgi:BlaI family penicillinase repressor